MTLDLDIEWKFSRYAGFGGPDRAYRYELGRRWGRQGYDNAVMFVGLNPSTADHETDDNTIRRCISFAQLWGYDALFMANLFAFRATDPEDMKAAADPVGPANDFILRRLMSEAKIIVACWGVHGAHLGRDREMIDLMPQMFCLGKTKDGHPRHPLYLAADTKLEHL